MAYAASNIKVLEGLESVRVRYSVIVNRCEKYPDKVTKLTLKSKDFRYMTEEEYKYYKVHKSDKVISYVRL